MIKTHLNIYTATKEDYSPSGFPWHSLDQGLANNFLKTRVSPSKKIFLSKMFL